MVWDFLRAGVQLSDHELKERRWPKEGEITESDDDWDGYWDGYWEHFCDGYPMGLYDRRNFTPKKLKRLGH